MPNIAVASLKHRRLKKGLFIGDAHGNECVECINAHCWIISSDGSYILLQRRAKTERVFTNMLDISIAGHVDWGEDPKTTIIRETKEEANIDIRKYINNKPKKIYFSENSMFSGTQFKHNQQAYIFYAIIDHKLITNIQNQNEEVGGFELYTIESFIDMVNDKNEELAPHPMEYYKVIIHDILSIKHTMSINF